MSKQNKFKDMMKPKEQGSVYDQFLGPIENPNVNTSDNTNTDDIPSENPKVNLTEIPVVRTSKGIRDTHKTKAFYIRNDIAKLIEQDIRKGKRGDMTVIVNALFEQYYIAQGRLKGPGE